MRVTLGVLSVLGLSVAVAGAQPPAQQGRAATLKAPQAIPPEELPPVARGAVPDFPSTSVLPSTPVARPGVAPARQPASHGPAWLTTEPDVVPAGGHVPKGSVRQLTLPTSMRQDAAPQPRIIDRLFGPPTDPKPAVPPVPQPRVQEAPRQPPAASTAFRGTGSNGAPVYAGPPAYRWYGYGSVTPGANPLAPAGQYPVASANWYKLTGATPGAFPVPVTNSGQPTPGFEPPSYGVARSVPEPADVVAQPQPAYQQPPQPRFAPAPPRPELPKYTPPADSKFMPGPSVAGAPVPAPNFQPPAAPTAKVNVPTIAPVPAPNPAAVAPPVASKTEPVAAREVVKGPAAPPVVRKPEPIIPPEIPKPDQAALVPSVLPSAEPEAPAVPPQPVAAANEPKPLPTSVTTDPPRPQYQWQSAEEPATPQPGTWAPTQGAAPLPTQPAEQPQSWQTGGAPAKPVARGQVNDKSPDPLAAVIKQVCNGRADGVEIRWTGTKKLCVCFEARTAGAAQMLVGDISKRPELTAYQIDFCVVVK